MLKIGDIIEVTERNNAKFVVIGFKEFTIQNTVFHLFADNFMNKLYDAKAIFYPVSALDKPLMRAFAVDKPLMETLAKSRDNLFDSVKVIGKMDINSLLIKSQMTVGTQLPLLSDDDMVKFTEKPLRTVKELEKRLRAYPENEKYRYLNVVNQHYMVGSIFEDDSNYYIDNDFNVLYYKDYKLYKVGKVKGKTIADKYINLITHAYTELRDGKVEEYEPKLDFYFQKKTKIFCYNEFMFVSE